MFLRLNQRLHDDGWIEYEIISVRSELVNQEDSEDLAAGRLFITHYDLRCQCHRDALYDKVKECHLEAELFDVVAEEDLLDPGFVRSLLD